ncbi:MAG: 30S ribosomal protein S12 methylthiotransferase RimO, partial [Caulobacter sp.]|nr:30S ribosomal protein S12 methylthiotransferase RimO [Caulobacter sp.]
EGCNHKCKFCIIPDMRGRLQSRPARAVLREAEKLVESGVKELLVISQDTSAFGTDWKDREVKAPILPLARDLGSLGAWVRLHYVYPYPHVRELIPLMADPANGVLPYLDIPFQHGHPEVLKRMARPAASARTLDEIAAWRAICPEITLRSTFIVGYPGETEAEFQTLLDWLDEAQLDRVGCFKYENVEHAESRMLEGHLPEEVKEERWHRFMALQAEISAERAAAQIGTVQDVIIDGPGEEPGEILARSKADAPEIDGVVYLSGATDVSAGDIVSVRVTDADEYDLYAEPA